MNGMEIKQLRLKLGLTQDQLAKKIGVTFLSVNRWEREKSHPSPLAMEKILALKEKTKLRG